MKEYLYNGPAISIGNSGIRIKKNEINLPFSQISSVSVKKAHSDKLWLLYVILGSIAVVLLIGMFYNFLVNFYLAAETSNGTFHYPRRSMGVTLAMMIIIPVLITFRIWPYFRRYLVLIIKWNHHEFRIKLSSLKLPPAVIKNYFEGKINGPVICDIP